MARFDRSDIEGNDLATSLAAVTDELRSSLEREIREIVEAAKGRAAEIEEEARRRGVYERASDQDAEEILEDRSDRLSRLIDGIDLLESTFRGMLVTLRTEVDGLRAERVEPRSLREPPAQEEGDLDQEAANGESPVLSEEGLHESVEQSHPVPLKLITGAHDSPENRLQVEEMIRGHIRKMFENGRPRAEAELFLTRFKSGRNYRWVLEEIYPPDEISRDRGRRRIASRLRRRRHR